MTARLLLVDGTNVVMRCASIQAAAPTVAIEMAAAIVRRAVRTVEATHLVVAFDAPGAGVRSTVYPAYKANRTTDTAGWVTAGTAAFEAEGMCCVAAPGYEADDVIATIAGRARGPVEILSGDSDLLALAWVSVRVWRFDKNAPGGIACSTAEDVCRKYGIPTPKHLTLYKALVGEKGDNVPGMPGIGPVRASKMIAEFGDLVTMQRLGVLGEHSAWIEKAVTLLTLYDFAPVPPIDRAATAVRFRTEAA